MENHACVENNKFIVGLCSYSTVIIPPSLTIRSKTYTLLKNFADAGGSNKLIFIRPCPTRIDGVETDIIWPDGVIEVDSVDEAVEIADKKYHSRIKIIDERTGLNAHKIIYHRRKSDDSELLFIANTDEKREVYTRISLPGTGKPVFLDLTYGKAYDIPVEIMDGRTEFKLKFYPAGSILLHYPSSDIATEKMPVFVDTGIELENKMKCIQSIREWKVKLKDQNVMPLNQITLFLDGKEVLKNQPIIKAWHDLFYKASDGTPFRVEYSFNVINIPKGEVFAAIEVAENLDKITLNGEKVKPLKTRGELGIFDECKSWKDLNFTKVPLNNMICKGSNTIVLEGKKVNNITGMGNHIRLKDFSRHVPTEIEAVYIVGDFTVVDENKVKFFIDGNSLMPCSMNLTNSGYPFYAGKASFSASINYKTSKNKVCFKVNDVEAACIELYINNQYAGLKYWAPYVFDITELLKEGKNEIEILAATTLANLMGPNWITGIQEEKAVVPGTFIDLSRYTEKYSLFPFGIGCGSLIE
jgi:hypothetical protein